MIPALNRRRRKRRLLKETKQMLASPSDVQECQELSLLDLPHAAMVEVLAHLPLRQIYRMGSVSKFFADLVMSGRLSDDLWVAAAITDTPLKLGVCTCRSILARGSPWGQVVSARMRLLCSQSNTVDISKHAECCVSAIRVPEPQAAHGLSALVGIEQGLSCTMEVPCPSKPGRYAEHDRAPAGEAVASTSSQHHKQLPDIDPSRLHVMSSWQGQGGSLFVPPWGLVLARPGHCKLYYLPLPNQQGRPADRGAAASVTPQIVELISHERAVQAIAADPSSGLVVSSSEAGGDWGPRCNCDVVVWDLAAGGNVRTRLTVHREHALTNRQPLAIRGDHVVVLTENYVMDLSVDSSTVVKVYNIHDAREGQNPVYRGSVTRGGYSDLASEYSVIKAVQLTDKYLVLASDGSGFNPFTWYDVYELEGLQHLHTIQQRFMASPLGLELSPQFLLLDDLLLATDRGSNSIGFTTWDLATGDRKAMLRCSCAATVTVTRAGLAKLADLFALAQWETAEEGHSLDVEEGSSGSANVETGSSVSPPGSEDASSSLATLPVAVFEQSLQGSLLANPWGEQVGVDFQAPETITALWACPDGTHLAASTTEGALLIMDLGLPNPPARLRRRFLSAAILFGLDPESAAAGRLPCITQSGAGSSSVAWQAASGQSGPDAEMSAGAAAEVLQDVREGLRELWMWTDEQISC